MAEHRLRYWGYKLSQMLAFEQQHGIVDVERIAMGREQLLNRIIQELNSKHVWLVEEQSSLVSAGTGTPKFGSRFTPVATDPDPLTLDAILMKRLKHRIASVLLANPAETIDQDGVLSWQLLAEGQYGSLVGGTVWQLASVGCCRELGFVRKNTG